MLDYVIMIIIGEKINGALPSVEKAISERDEAFIRELAVRQSECGADYLDICAGCPPSAEMETLDWLIGVAQEAADTPLCVDSPDCDALIYAIKRVKKPGILNSVSGARGKCEKLLPKAADSEWKIIALACGDRIPCDAAARAAAAASVVEKAKYLGISEERLFVDPLVMSVAAESRAMINFLDTMGLVRERYPSMRTVAGISNISFGMPLRGSVNRHFLAAAIAAGLDSAILDPTLPGMRAALYSMETLMGRDENGVDFLRAYRDKTIG